MIELLHVEYDLELIAQKNLQGLLQEGISRLEIGPETNDNLGRSLIHQCCIFGNLSMMKDLEQVWGEGYLHKPDIFDTSLAHFCARNGHLEMLKYLKSKNVTLYGCESRFQTTPLDLAIAMKHFDVIDFFLEGAPQNVLDMALLSSASEGNVSQVISFQLA